MSTSVTTAAASVAAAHHALHLAALAYSKGSPKAAPLLEKAVELWKSAGCTANLQYASK